jgi:hypothetical protein
MYLEIDLPHVFQLKLILPLPRRPRVTLFLTRPLCQFVLATPAGEYVSEWAADGDPGLGGREVSHGQRCTHRARWTYTRPASADAATAR